MTTTGAADRNLEQLLGTIRARPGGALPPASIREVFIRRDFRVFYDEAVLKGLVDAGPCLRLASQTRQRLLNTEFDKNFLRTLPQVVDAIFGTTTSSDVIEDAEFVKRFFDVASRDADVLRVFEAQHEDLLCRLVEHSILGGTFALLASVLMLEAAIGQQEVERLSDDPSKLRRLRKRAKDTREPSTST